MNRASQIFVATLLSTSGCDAFQDAVPGGVCSWVEPNRALAECSYVLETVSAANPDDELSQTGLYNQWGFVISEQTNGVDSFTSTYDDRGRQLSASNGQTSYTTEWEGCSNNVVSFDNDLDGLVDAVRTTDLRRGRPEFYTITYDSGEPYSVGEYQSEWSGRWLDSDTFFRDGVISSRTERSHSEDDGLHREEIRFFGTDSVFLGTDIIVTNGERELNGNDRTVLVESYDDMEQLTYRKRSVHEENSSTDSYDLDGDEEFDVVDLNELDPNGRLLVRRRSYTSSERASEVRLTWTCQ